MAPTNNQYFAKYVRQVFSIPFSIIKVQFTLELLDQMIVNKIGSGLALHGNKNITIITADKIGCSCSTLVGLDLYEVRLRR